jgi:galactose-1-phosphate uridylyltransferase
MQALTDEQYVSSSNDSLPNIFSLADIVFSLSDERQARFGRIFHLSSTVGRAVPPETMRAWITERFGTIEAVEEQYIIKVTNLLTLECALFNELRTQRPATTRSPQQVAEGVRAVPGDPLCSPETLTPADTFAQGEATPGRVHGKCCVTASSLLKIDGYHGLVTFEEHHPLRFTQSQLSEYLDVAWKWAELAHQEDPQARYYLVIWNCLKRAAASVVHGHLQMLLTRDMHYPKVEAWRRAAETYWQNYQQNYFDDLFKVHVDVGLGFISQGVRVMAHLTPIRERETLVIADVEDYARPGAFSRPFKRALFLALDAFINQLGVTAFNMAIYVPPLGETGEAWQGFPIIARLVDRGDSEDQVSDMGAMELYAASVIDTDPFRVAETLRTTFQKAL